MLTFEIYKDYRENKPPHPKAYYYDVPGMYDNWRIDVESLDELMSIVDSVAWTIIIYPAQTLSMSQVLPIIVID